MKTKNIYFAELTDTFGGEANYGFVHRFKIHANSQLGAIRKLARETGYRYRKQWDGGDVTRYDSSSGLTCVFLSLYEDQSTHFSLTSI